MRTGDDKNAQTSGTHLSVLKVIDHSFSNDMVQKLIRKSDQILTIRSLRGNKWNLSNIFA